MSAPTADVQALDRSAISITSERSKLIAAATSLPALAAAVAIAVFLFVALRRIAYPYELEWLESGMVQHVHRLASGNGIYTSPSYEFTQMPYAPLSFAVGAVLETVFGVHFWVMRSISLVSTIAVFALLFHIVRRETSSNVAGFIAAGVYAATFRLAGWWFDVGKADSMFLALTLAAVATARVATTHKRALIAASVMALALLTKQTAMFVLAPMAMYLLVTRWRVGLTYFLSTSALVGGVTLVLNAMTNGWYNFFVWKLLFQHEVIKENETAFFTRDLGPFWPVAVLIILTSPLLLRRKQLWSTGFFSMVVIGLAAGSWTSRLHSGGAENVLMPIFAGAAIATGLCLGLILQNRQRALMPAIAISLCLLQFAFLRYDPSPQLPTAADRRAGDDFIAWLRSVPGDVWVVCHPTYALLAGKSAFAGKGGVEDVLRGKTPEAKAALEGSIATAIHEKRFAAIILDGPADARGFPADWQQYYTQMPGSAVPSPTDFRPITNLTGHPRDVWVPIGTSLPMPPQ